MALPDMPSFTFMQIHSTETKRIRYFLQHVYTFSIQELPCVHFLFRIGIPTCSSNPAIYCNYGSDLARLKWYLTLISLPLSLCKIHTYCKHQREGNAEKCNFFSHTVLLKWSCSYCIVDFSRLCVSGFANLLF